MSFIQLLKYRVKPGADQNSLDQKWIDNVGRLPASGWQRLARFSNAADPREMYEIVWFDSEEKARASEKSEPHLALVQEMIAALEAEPTYVDLVEEFEASR